MNVKKLIALFFIAFSCGTLSLADNAVDVDKELVMAVSTGDVGAVQKWLDAGGDPDSIDRSSSRALAASVIDAGDSGMLSLLLEAGLDPNLEWSDSNYQKHSLLKDATFRYRHPLARLLVDHGANPESLLLDTRYTSPQSYSDKLVHKLIDELMQRRHDREQAARELLEKFGASQDVGRFIMKDVVGLPMQER